MYCMCMDVIENAFNGSKIFVTFADYRCLLGFLMNSQWMDKRDNDGFFLNRVMCTCRSSNISCNMLAAYNHAEGFARYCLTVQ